MDPEPPAPPALGPLPELLAELAPADDRAILWRLRKPDARTNGRTNGRTNSDEKTWGKPRDRRGGQLHKNGPFAAAARVFVVVLLAAVVAAAALAVAAGRPTLAQALPHRIDRCIKVCDVEHVRTRDQSRTGTEGAIAVHGKWPTCARLFSGLQGLANLDHARIERGHELGGLAVPLREQGHHAGHVARADVAANGRFDLERAVLLVQLGPDHALHDAPPKIAM